MYEDMTFENIMDRCLDRVSSSIDKREGSVVYDAIAPAAAELAIMYIELAYLMDRAFPDTESGDDLTKKVRERSIFRTPATAAIRKGYFEDGNGAAMDVPIGTRFSGDNLNYTVTEKIATGQFRLLCETPGAAGNQYQGNLFPIDYVEGLGAARLADILINGEDEESDEDLLDRYMDSLQAQAYGGNKADYKTKAIHAFPRIRTAPEITRSTRSRSTVSLASVRSKPWETSSRLLPDRRLQTMGSASTAKSECMWKKRTVPGVVLPRPTITERSRSKSRPIQNTLTQSMKRRSPRFLTW